MKKINKNILIIGGLGHWSNKTYLPALSDEFFEGKLIICDIKDNDTKYDFIKLTPKANEENIKLIRNKIKENSINVIIISTPPEYHYIYLKGLVDLGINIICDKPLIADYDYKEILNKYYYILNKKSNLIYSPLRRQIQSYYKKIYDEINLINKEYDQNVKLVAYYENDGCHRWDDEMEIDFAHGYKSGLGKLSHTGYHIIDIVSRIINEGCKNIQRISCEVLDENLVAENHNSKTNKNIRMLLGAKECGNYKLSEKTKNAELDITIKYTVYFHDDIPTYVYLFLRHSGVSHRATVHYDSKNTGDDGRTDDSTFLVEQGAFQNIYGSIFADSSNKGSNGKSYLTIKRHPIISENLGKKILETKKIINSEEMSTVEIVHDLINSFDDLYLQEKYQGVEFDNQILTMELFVAALISKQKHKKIDWEIGKLNDNLHRWS